MFTLCCLTKTGVCLLQDDNQEPFKVRLHLARDLLMLQEQDVLCVSGEPFYSGLSHQHLIDFSLKEEFLKDSYLVLEKFSTEVVK
ncbi:gamma-1-syntrophin [Cricetulus griseus]|uniref:Gamma-1-syntrophin n=1 Tax=Cricetulus griseus TaxID=10029 RepID=A0A061ICS9_CRIGR|nr:gamma-1-syntrophin [Cricetulus griseus]